MKVHILFIFVSVVKNKYKCMSKAIRVLFVVTVYIFAGVFGFAAGVFLSFLWLINKMS